MRVLALALLLAACSAHEPTRCEAVCRREKLCARELKVDLDEGECRDACTALDRDPAFQSEVDRHIGCVNAAAGCAAVLACE